MFVAGTLYFLIFGRFVLPNTEQSGITESYKLGQYITELRVQEGSPLIGKNLIESNLGRDYDISVLEIYRNKTIIWATAKHKFAAGDILLVRSDVDRLVGLAAKFKT